MEVGVETPAGNSGKKQEGPAAVNLPPAFPPKSVRTQEHDRSAQARVPPFRIAFAVGLAFVAVLATGIRFWPRDGIQLLAPVFYATPPGVTLGMATLSWLLVRKRGRRRLNWGTGLLVIVLAAVLVAGRQSHVQQPAAVKVGFWNIASGGLGWDPIVSQVASWDADIVGLAESNQSVRYDDPLVQRNFWLERFPGYSVIRFPRGMRLLTKHPAKVISKGKLGDRSNYGVAKLEINGEVVFVVMADFVSGPTFSRKPSFDALHEILGNLPAGPVILMGDMNTPTESVHFDDLRRNFRNAFEERGSGFYHSWPMPMPVLPLDQVWVNEAMSVGSCELEWTLRSDHRPLVCTLSIRKD